MGLKYLHGPGIYLHGPEMSAWAWNVYMGQVSICMGQVYIYMGRSGHSCRQAPDHVFAITPWYCPGICICMHTTKEHLSLLCVSAAGLAYMCCCNRSLQQVVAAALQPQSVPPPLQTKPLCVRDRVGVPTPVY